MASKRNGTLYIGVTSDLIGRVWEHKNNILKGFTQKYEVHDLVWYEELERIDEAIYREKQMKTWKREWKVELIEKSNLDWKDLYPELL